MVINHSSAFNKHFKNVLLFVFFTFSAICLANAQNNESADKEATAETQMLYKNMLKLTDKGIMFGHHEDMAYGVGWAYEKDRSDVKSITNSYPAVYGWDAGRIELDSLTNIDGVPFDKMEAYFKEVYSRGGVNTISWHMADPVTHLPSLSRPDSSVWRILNDAGTKKSYLQNLDKFAAFLEKLKGPNGEMIPVIFRPFHELTGNWFWWGKSSCAKEDFIAMWRLTIDYLRDNKHLHNLLLSYSVADFYTEDDFMNRYPGDNYVDMLGFDAYCDIDSTLFANKLNYCSELLQKIAISHRKMFALTEFGYNQIPVADWWTKAFLPIISKYRFSYVLAWRNWSNDHYFAPYPGQISADDFKLFYDDPRTIFQNDLNSMMYKKSIK